jgi:hypothetical protein
VINPRLKEHEPVKSHAPVAEGYLRRYFVHLLIDVDGKTYEKRIEVADSESVAKLLGFIPVQS